MKKTLLGAICLWLGMMNASAATVNYTVDNESIFPNPERGFLHQQSRNPNTANYNAVVGKESELVYHAGRDNVSLILVLYYLDEFRNNPTLPQAVLDAFDADMQVLRQYGMKAIIRLAYAKDYYGDDKTEIKRSADDAPLSIIESHLDRYKSHFASNADVIFTFEAGFVGQYGEWYYTDNFGNHVPEFNANCRALLDTALKVIPQDRCLLVRRPMFKTEYLDGVALTSEEAYTGTNKARLGHFNDAFLYDAYNRGTYSTDPTVRANQKALIAQETLYVPLGGETDITDSDKAAIWATYAATTTEMSTLHWTFCKNSYSETVTNMWRENHTFDTLKMYMGYRYQLVDATLPAEANAGDEVNIAMNIKNVGYAPLYNERHAYLVFKNATDSFAVQLATDPRRWLPNKETTAINEAITIPNDAPAGTYNLYLNLPDAYASLAHDPRYSVRFANTGVWTASNGMNNLQAEIEISGGNTPVSFTETLNKANITTVSENIAWDGDYFYLNNTTEWTEWTVNFTTPGKYLVSEVGKYHYGHNYLLQLLDGETVKSEFTTAPIYKTSTGDTTIVQDSKWDLCNIKADVYTLRVKNVMDGGDPKLKSIKFDLFGAVSTDTVVLPATLNKANVADYSEKIGWYNTDYFDFGVKDADNTDHWVKWRVNLKYPGEYTITEVTYCENEHKYTLQLLDGETVKSEYTTVKQSGQYVTQNVTHTTKWNLSSVPAGQYILRVNNATNWGRPKLKSLTLEYDGELPTGIEETQEREVNGQAYDILGRPVDESYHGIVIQDGKKRIQ